MSHAKKYGLNITIFLSMIIAITPLAVDMYLPALGMIAQSMDSDITQLSQSLSIYLAGYAIGMLIFGPLCDKYGRLPLVTFGLLSFGLISLLLALSQTEAQFFTLRFMQAFCGSAATVAVPGYIRHIYQQDTAKGMAHISLMMMLAPLIAPTLGSLVITISSWHTIFYLLGAYAILLLCIAYKPLAQVQTDAAVIPTTTIQKFKIVFNTANVPLLLMCSLITAFAFFCYITSAAFIYLEVFNVSEQLFTLLFAANVMALMLANRINVYLLRKKEPLPILKAAAMVALISALALILVNLWSSSYLLTAICFFPLMGAIGMMSVNADALVLLQFSHNTGTATAVMGSLKFSAGALSGPLLALLYTGSAVPAASIMFSCSLLVLLLCFKIKS
ncbi:Bcr/CflA family efflux MFS transporter [Shewanella marina]|uniref:Bcr/CflA family efflux MFS transporter n=1 Tax=Shewanella marina TaxID=487319 RepID=UPI00046E7FDA|nr:Bcr/CflA family efflux MFS transporter [Shewanella marina]